MPEATSEGPLRIKVVGGPDRLSYEVFDAESGKRLTNVLLASVEITPDDGAVGKVVLHSGIELDVELSPGAITAVGLPMKKSN